MSTQEQSRGNHLRFESWAHSYRIRRLARDLGMGDRRQSVYEWIHGKQGKHPVAPSLSYMRQIIALSEREPFAFGPLTYDDMLDGTAGLRGATRTVSPQQTVLSESEDE